MLTLFQQPLCPLSRFVRLALGEYGLTARLVDERFWERREEFLVLNPAGTLPVGRKVSRLVPPNTSETMAEAPSCRMTARMPWR